MTLGYAKKIFNGCVTAFMAGLTLWNTHSIVWPES